MTFEACVKSAKEQKLAGIRYEKSGRHSLPRREDPVRALLLRRGRRARVLDVGARRGRERHLGLRLLRGVRKDRSAEGADGRQ